MVLTGNTFLFATVSSSNISEYTFRIIGWGNISWLYAGK